MTTGHRPGLDTGTERLPGPGLAERASAADAYSRPAAEVARNLGVDPRTGLGSGEAQLRLEPYGPNRLAETRRESPVAAARPPQPGRRRTAAPAAPVPTIA